MLTRKVVSLTLVVFVTLGFALFVSIVYLDYFYSPISGYTLAILADYGAEPGQPDSNCSLSSEQDEMLQSIIQWAIRNETVLYWKSPFSPGLAMVDFSGDRQVHLTYQGDIRGTVVISEDLQTKAYAVDGILFPHSDGYKIVGRYDAAKLPAFARNSGFIYSLKDIIALDGIFYVPTENIKSFERLFDNSPFHLSYRGEVRLDNLFQRLFEDGFISRSLFIAVIGIAISSVFTMAMEMKEKTFLYYIHHLFGLTYWKMFRKEVFAKMSVSIITIAGYWFFLNHIFSHISRDEKFIILGTVLSLVTVFWLIINSIIFKIWKWQETKGRYLA